MTRIAAHRYGSIRRAALLVLAGGWLLAGCKVVTVAEDKAIRARQGGTFDASRYVAEIWTAKALPAIAARAVPLATLMPAVAADVDRAGASFGRRVGEGSAWTFVVKGTGRLVSVDRTSRRGSAVVEFPGGTVTLRTGPVVEGTAVRDALPFVAFDGFADQLAFADVGRALTARALAGVAPAVARLRPGRDIRFVGIANIREPDAPLVITPVAIDAD